MSVFPAELLLAPVGAGKTAYALDRVVEVVEQQPFTAVWTLLPSKRQEDALRQRLIERPGSRRVYFNVSFFSFYTLYDHLLDLAQKPQRKLDDTARVRLLRVILKDLKRSGKLEIYGSIAETLGFAQIVSDLIYELKQNVVNPDDFIRVAQDGSAKDRDLARIYNAYQESLREHDLVDREGVGWLALDEVRSNPQIGAQVALLLADGFDQFNPLQARLLALLATRARQTVITLPTVPGRESTVGRRFVKAFDQIKGALDDLQQPYTVRHLANSPDQGRSAGLRYLSQNSFGAGIVAPQPSEGCLTLLEAPDPAQEAGALMRRVKRLLLAGAMPDDIVIAVRDWERYGAALAAARQYRLPIALHYGEKLATNPAIIALLNLLELSSRDFRRRDVLDALRAPYFIVDGLTGEWLSKLERVSQSQLVISGRADWLEAIRLAARISPDSDDEREPPLLTNDEADYLAAQLTRFFDALTPPPHATIGGYIRWLENLIGDDPLQDPDDDPAADTHSQSPAPASFAMLAQVRWGTDDLEIADRDLVALRGFKGVLRSLLIAQNLLRALKLEAEAATTWGDFLNDLKAALGTATVNSSPNRSGRVLVTTVADARGLPHKHVIIPGLSEGLFPLPTPEDPLYLDSERRDLTARGVPLETQAERAADEGLFYELINLAQETLTLSRPTVQNGALWPESHLWRAVRLIFSDSAALIERERIPLGGVIKAADAATYSEAALVVAAALNAPALKPDEVALYNWLVSAHDAGWQRIRTARQIERGRMTRRSFDHYSGVLRAARLREWVAAELGNERVWSASQFNDYGQCGFRFFAKRLLRLEELKEPEEGMDNAQLGTLNHAILEETYRRLAAAGVTITPNHADTALETLRAVAREKLRAAPQEIGFRTSALWEQEQVSIIHRLEALVRLDFSKNSPLNKLFGDTPRQPYLLESPFSDGDQNVIELLIHPDIGSLRVTGYIDRIDRQGARIILIDYKSGSTTIPTKEMQRGRSFQMMLYLLAGQVILSRSSDPDAPREVAGGLFWHLRNGKTSGEIQTAQRDDAQAIDEGREQLAAHIARGRAGRFAVHPNRTSGGRCSHYCEFNQFCRISIMRRTRGEN